MNTLHALPDERYPVLSKVFSAVVWATGVSAAEIMGDRRPAQVATARQVCFYLARKNTGLSDEEIGSFFNGKDRGTVIHGRNSIEKRLTFRNERELQQLVERAQRQLESLLVTPEHDSGNVSIDALLEVAEQQISSARSDVASGLPRIARARMIAVSKALAESQYMLGELEAIIARNQACLPHAG